MARFWMASAVASITGPTFPWGTLLINIVGSFVIGLFAHFTSNGGSLNGLPEISPLVMVGLCGGFTTFSSFNLQTLDLFRAGEVALGSVYVLSALILCLISVWVGTQL